MTIEYQETPDDLRTRIDIHARYGKRDIDAWMLEMVGPRPDQRILDVGCGSGKQCFAFYDHLRGRAKIVGGDVSAELLAEARHEAQRRQAPIEFTELDFNRRFPFPDEDFDRVTCCFAIYYARYVPATVGEMHRVLRTGGRLFTSGPMPENKKVFYEVIQEATGRPIPPMPGSSRYGSEILQAIRARFRTVQVEIFENPLVFEDAEPFLAYTRASLSEDRKLWSGMFLSAEDFERVMEQIAETARRRLDRDGRLVMTKVVGGFLATK